VRRYESKVNGKGEPTATAAQFDETEPAVQIQKQRQMPSQ
jgi:hypothetical protein